MQEVDRTFSLPAEQATYIDQLVQAGAYVRPTRSSTLAFARSMTATYDWKTGFAEK